MKTKVECSKLIIFQLFTIFYYWYALGLIYYLLYLYGENTVG